jgi:hypothetical protein
LWKIGCNSPSEQVLQQLHQQYSIPDDFQLIKSHHVTLVYFKDQVDKKIDDFWQTQEGKVVYFTSNLVLHNNETWALKVDITRSAPRDDDGNIDSDMIFQNQSCFQKNLHITLAYRNTSSPADALKLFATDPGDSNDIQQIWLETPLVLSGTVRREGSWKR